MAFVYTSIVWSQKRVGFLTCKYRKILDELSCYPGPFLFGNIFPSVVEILVCILFLNGGSVSITYLFQLFMGWWVMLLRTFTFLVKVREDRTLYIIII